MSCFSMALYCAALSLASQDISSAEAQTSHVLDWRQKVQEFSVEHFRHAAWGYSHSVRDYHLARELAELDHVELDDDVLFAAAHLHDMGMFSPWAVPKRDHADIAADTAPSILKEAGFPLEKIAMVQNAIRTHMYDREPQGFEAIYLHDADALDWLGAIGAARLLALIDTKGGKPQGSEILPMFGSNLAEVPGRVLSPAGRARVAERQAELEQFLRALRNETDNLRDF